MTISDAYHAARKLHPEAILLFPVGDYYEAAYVDAERLGVVLGLTVLHSQPYDNMAIAGFPRHSLHQYANQLIALGHDVVTIEL